MAAHSADVRSPDAMTDSDKKISLEIPSTIPGVLGGFGLLLPTELCAESFATIRAQLEFRRKCMNQGFDNLLELLAMHEKTLLANKGKETP